MSKTILGQKVCGTCKHAILRGDDKAQGYLCRRFPPTVQMLPLVPAIILPYVLGMSAWGPPPADLAAPVDAAKGKPAFYPMVSFPGIAAGDTCGEWAPKLESMN